MKTTQPAALIAALAVFLWVAPALGAADFPVISTADLKAKLDAKEPLLLLNPLSDIEFNEGYIPGSVNIPLHTIGETDKLPADKNTLIVTYCLGPK